MWVVFTASGREHLQAKQQLPRNSMQSTHHAYKKEYVLSVSAGWHKRSVQVNLLWKLTFALLNQSEEKQVISYFHCHNGHTPQSAILYHNWLHFGWWAFGDEMGSVVSIAASQKECSGFKPGSWLGDRSVCSPPVSVRVRQPPPTVQ